MTGRHMRHSRKCTGAQQEREWTIPPVDESTYIYVHYGIYVQVRYATRIHCMHMSPFVRLASPAFHSVSQSPARKSHTHTSAVRDRQTADTGQSPSICVLVGGGSDAPALVDVCRRFFSSLTSQRKLASSASALSSRLRSRWISCCWSSSCTLCAHGWREGAHVLQS